MFRMTRIFRQITNDIYQAKTDKIVAHERVFKLQEECSKFDMFINVNDGMTEINESGLVCVYEGGKKIGGIISKKTYYFFNGNTCIVYNKSGYDRIIRILVKDPDEKWNVFREMGEDRNYHLKTTTKYFEVYDWWDVDWMQCGKRNYDYCVKQGPWWKTVYEDVCGIYETVAKKGIDSVFNDIYNSYEKTGKA